MGARTGGRLDPFQLVGTTLDRRFRIDAEVAEGGFGVVYQAYQITLDRPVALKVLKVPGELSAEERSQFQRNFAAEARTIARLRHPSIVEVFDFGVSDERNGAPLLWMALEWLDGRTLEGFLEAQRGEPPVSPAAALAFLRPALETIAYAHSQGVVHRDLKPGNLMITTVHGQRFLKVLDFGISKIMTAHETRVVTGRTTRGATGFSPAYAAPEQLAHGRTGPWTDVHAIGLMLTELLTNLPPFGSSDQQIFEQVLSQERPTPGRRGVNIDVGPWEAILQKATALSPSERHSDAGALLRALSEALPEIRDEDRAVIPRLLEELDDRTVVDADPTDFPENTEASPAARAPAPAARFGDDPVALASRLTTPGLGPAPAALAPGPLLLHRRKSSAPPLALPLARARATAGRLRVRWAPALRQRWPLLAGGAAGALAMVVALAFTGSSRSNRVAAPVAVERPAASVSAQTAGQPARAPGAPGAPGSSAPGARRAQPGWEPLQNRPATSPTPAASAAAAEPLPAAAPGKRRYVLMLASDPPGATVLIDGKPQGITPTSVVSRRRRHNVVFQLPGHSEHRLTTDARSPWQKQDSGDQILQLDARLEPVAPPPPP